MASNEERIPSVVSTGPVQADVPGQRPELNQRAHSSLAAHPNRDVFTFPSSIL